MADGFRELPIASVGVNIHTPSAQDPIIGIDLGTTNSLVAIVKNGVPIIIPSREGKNIVPSVVHFSKNGETEVGFSAKNERAHDARHTVFSVKRLLGRGVKDIEAIRHELPFDLDESSANNVKIRIDGRSYTPIEISSIILRELKAAAEEHLGRSVEDAVITVPAYFNDSQRQATRAAGKIAGLNVLRILNEPTAASLAYGLQKKKNGLIAVYDLGGGTFDVSILRLRDGIFEVLATHGDTRLGGDDIDNGIASWIESTVLSTYPQAKFAGVEARGALLDAAEKLKIALTEKISATTEIATGDGKKVSVTLSQVQLENIATPLFERTRTACESALTDAGIERSELTDVVLVGGPTRMPLLRKFVTELFGREANHSLNPDEVVALGAAIQADILAGNNKDFLLLDVVPLSLGIETFGGAMSKLIPRNTRIPTVAKEQFTTYVEGQTKVAINVFQGERELVEHNRKLGEFVLHGIPPLPAGVARVEVTFLVDADGILNAGAKEIYSDIEQSIEIKPSYGLTDAEVERMLSDYITHAQNDVFMKQVIEAKNDARTILSATEKSLPKVRDQLSNDEAIKIEALMARVRKAIDTTDLVEIKNAHKDLNSGTVHLAEVLMQASLEKDMRHKHMDKFVKD